MEATEITKKFDYEEILLQPVAVIFGKSVRAAYTMLQLEHTPTLTITFHQFIGQIFKYILAVFRPMIAKNIILRKTNHKILKTTTPKATKAHC